MGFFTAKPPVSQDEFEWLMACIVWLHRQLDEGEDGFAPELALSSSAQIANADTASALFDGVRELAGLEEWSCRLEPGEAQPDLSASGLIGEFSRSGANGTFSVEDDEVVIRYDPELLKSPDALAATFAHELSHFLLAGLKDLPPGGEALEEHATDCTAIYLGFGVLLANSARSFEQFQDAGTHGWRAQSSGYLSEQARVTALAIWLRLQGMAEERALKALKPYLQGDLKKALKYIDRNMPDMSKHVAQFDLTDWA